jgi:N-acetyl-alpha-D-glucosaminyl L-malate synthase BshA
VSRPLNVGIVCYASVGGSGIVATELGKALALRGHQAHFISTETPFRLGDFQEGLFFHQVLTPTYPLFREPQYLLSLANRIVQVARESKLDIIHAHYAVPHATAAFLSRQILSADGPAPRVVTTLHGTDNYHRCTFSSRPKVPEAIGSGPRLAATSRRARVRPASLPCRFYRNGA